MIAPSRNKQKGSTKLSKLDSQKDKKRFTCSDYRHGWVTVIGHRWAKLTGVASINFPLDALHCQLQHCQSNPNLLRNIFSFSRKFTYREKIHLKIIVLSLRAFWEVSNLFIVFYTELGKFDQRIDFILWSVLSTLLLRVARKYWINYSNVFFSNVIYLRLIDFKSARMNWKTSEELIS